MESWVRLRLADQLHVCAGITTTFLDRALAELFGLTGFPSKLELILRLEEELTQMQEEYSELATYLKGKEKRVVMLAKQLATLFQRYGIYGNTACGLWESKSRSWQEELWKRIFSTWDYPLKRLKALEKPTQKVSIHLFAFSHIPPLYFHFFQQLSDVHFYQLSACQEFWSDLTVEHPVLTHFGRVGREMAKLVEESELLIDEHYVDPETSNALHLLQREMLTLKKGERGQGEGLELHTSHTEHHEIENLHDTLMRLPYEPKDMIVMAPDITRYEPYIRAIFGKTLPYQIADMPMHKSDPEITALFMLIELEAKRWSAPALLELFHHPLFAKKMGWNDDDLLQIATWIEQTGIRWGLDAKHRDHLLKKRHCKEGIDDGGATWETGIGLLLEELAIAHTPTRIDFTQAELLGEWKDVIDRLRVDLHLVDAELTMRAWVDRLTAMCERYLWSSENIQDRLEKLARAARHSKERTYTFETVMPLLVEVMGEKSVTINGNQLQAVRFCSMLPMRAIPAKVICLIGMNHDTFPRQESLFSLDLLKEEGDYAPSRLDFDRYLFLEALLSAREKLIISYIDADPIDQTPWPPSSVVTPLLPYLSKTVKHPVHLPLNEKTPQPQLFVYPKTKITIPTCQLDVNSFTRAFRSPLRHYLAHREIFVRDEKAVQGEEALHLSPLRKAILRKEGKEALARAHREGDFPIGPLGELARFQMEKEVDALPHDVERCEIDVQVGPVHLVGALDGVKGEELHVFEKKNVRGAVRSWPHFLLLTAMRPKTQALHFLQTGKRLERFFDDPLPHLQRALRYYFLSEHAPSPLFPEWVEPILKQDPIKLEKASSYDGALAWALRGQNPLPPAELIIQWKEEAESLYKEMCDAWF